MLNLLIRGWKVARARMIWGWRFHFLGARSVVGRCRLARNPGMISIDHHTSIEDGWSLADLEPPRATPNPKIRIGAYCNFMHDFQCNALLSVEIQDHVLIAPRVFITDSDHVVAAAGERTTLSNKFVSAPVVIEHDCWLGVNAVILKGVTIGHHSIVGANAVVTKSFGPYSIIAGAPAKLIGQVKTS